MMALTGCARTDVVSVKSPSYDRTPQRLFVAATLGAPFRVDPTAQLPTDSQIWFRNKLIAVLQSCGISSEVELVDGPAPDSPPDPSALEFLLGVHSATQTGSDPTPASPLSQRAQAFAPDAILRIQLVSTIMGRAPSAAIRSQVPSAAYHLDMTDWTSNQVVWQADQTITHGSDFASVFEKSFVGQMVKDKILPASCIAD